MVKNRNKDSEKPPQNKAPRQLRRSPIKSAPPRPSIFPLKTWLLTAVCSP